MSLIDQIKEAFDLMCEGEAPTEIHINKEDLDTLDKEIKETLNFENKDYEHILNLKYVIDNNLDDFLLV